ncbi:ABC transporter permease subunit, partial [Microbacterium sp. Leaf351]
MNILTDYPDLWGEALRGTLVLFLGGGAIALLLGLIVGAMRVSPVPIARAVGAVYVNWIRNTPLTLVMFFFAFCVPLLVPGRADFVLLA